MAYQALYRKLRPKDFSHMVAQETVIDTLRNQVITERIAHAYLFCGSRGTGKTSTAKILARAINCENPVNGDPCGECENCRRALAEENMDILEIDAASNNGVDEMRDLRETVKYPPQYGKFKVYIIDEVHMLSVSAFNALLKTLEEPPAHVVFILATTEPQKLPATILSRCQRFDFGRIPANQIMSHLREAVDGANGKATDGALMLIARAAEGGMRDALSILDMCLGYSQDITEQLVHNVLGTSDRSFLFTFAEAMAENDLQKLICLIDDMMRSGREPVVFARDISDHLRSLLTAKCCSDELEQLLDVTPEDSKEYQQQAERFTMTRLIRMMDYFMQVEMEMHYASSPRLCLETATLKACMKTQETDSQALIDRMTEMENKILSLESRIQDGVVVKTDTSAKKTETSVRAAPVPVIPGDVNQAWKEAMNIFQKSELSIFNILKLNGKFIGCKGNEYQWQTLPDMDIFVDMANKRSAKIAEVLSQVTGSTCEFRALSADATQKEATATEEEYLRTMRQTFGPEAVTVVD